MSTIINLYGTGKSTTAAFLFYMLKAGGYNAELVREYAKDWAWDNRKVGTYDQLYFFGKQVRKESMLYSKVDWLITDSPVWFSYYYAKKYCPIQLAEGIRSVTEAFYRQAEEDGHKPVHVFLHRTKGYNPAGRYQTEEQAREIDGELKGLLDELKLPYTECGTDENSLVSLLKSLGA